MSSRGGIAVGFFAFLAGLGLAFDLPFPFVDDDFGVGKGDLLGVWTNGTAMMWSPESSAIWAWGIADAGSGLAPFSLDGPASGVAVWAL